MNLTNPTEENLEIQYLGKTYKIGAKKTVELADEVATYWKKSIHTFLIVTGESKEEVTELEEAPDSKSSEGEEETVDVEEEVEKIKQSAKADTKSAAKTK